MLGRLPDRGKGLCSKLWLLLLVNMNDTSKYERHKFMRFVGDQLQKFFKPIKISMFGVVFLNIPGTPSVLFLRQLDCWF